MRTLEADLRSLEVNTYLYSTTRYRQGIPPSISQGNLHSL